MNQPHRIDLRTSKTPFPKSILLRRITWNLVAALLFRPSPRIFFNGWRCALLRAFGAKIGSDVVITSSVKVWFPWELEIGDASWIGSKVEIYNFAKVKIGSQTVVSQYTYLCTGTHDYKKSNFPLIFFPITIGDEAWVASSVFVAPGITIGSGAIIAANSVVVKDQPEWTICGGNPCKAIKPRPDIESAS